MYKLKIAVILPSLAFKGPILVAQNIVNNLSHTADITVYYFDDIKEVKFNTRIERIKFSKPIEFEKYDIIHSHMFRPDLYVTLWSALGKCSRPKKISTIHQFIDHDFKIQHPYWKAKLASKLWHSSLKKFDTLVTLNELMLQTYVSKYPKNCVVKVHNGISPDEITDEIPEFDHLELKEFIQNRICLGAAAQLTKNKGFHQVIDMLKLDENLCFVLIGDGAQLENLKLQAVRNKVENQVLFFGKKNNAKKFFSYFDVFMMTSEREGFPMSLLEAASMSVPSVCSDNLIFRNIFSSEEVCFFEQNNTPSLYEAVMNVCKKKLNFASDFNKRFLIDYTSQKMAMNYLSIYKCSIKKKT